MNFECMPELKWRAGYSLAVGVTLLGCVFVYRRLHRAGWVKPISLYTSHSDSTRNACSVVAPYCFQNGVFACRYVCWRTASQSQIGDDLPCKCCQRVPTLSELEFHSIQTSL